MPVFVKASRRAKSHIRKDRTTSGLYKRAVKLKNQVYYSLPDKSRPFSMSASRKKTLNSRFKKLQEITRKLARQMQK